MTAVERIWSTESLPFNMAVVREPSNPPGFPDVLPFTLGVHLETGLVVQIPFPTLAGHLEAVYAHGSMIGTPLDDTGAGRAIAHEFVDHVHTALRGGVAGRHVLEVGCGRGFVLRRLAEAGAEAVGVEPGLAYAPWWDRHGVRVVPGLFPHPDLRGPYEAIVAYGVLEHIAAPEAFLADVRMHLAPGGAIALSVPRCTPFLEAGDPSTLLHEHYSYFTESSLARVVTRAGFRVASVRPAREAGAMTVIAHRPDSDGAGRVDAEADDPAPDLDRARSFAARLDIGRSRFAAALAAHREGHRTLGLYCPGRGRAYLDHADDLRFFDDDAEKVGTFIPPFEPAIESRAALRADPVDEIWILSRTYGDRIRASLAGEPALEGVTVRTLDALLHADPIREA